MKKKEWVVKEPEREKIKKLSSTLGISETIATILINRGVEDVEEASIFLQAKLKNLPDPFLIKDSEKGAKIIIEAVKARKKIVIYGDYDVDGITSTVVMYLFLSHIGGNVTYHIPHRMEDGYGLNTYALEEIATDGGELVITVDCGITSIEEVKYAKKIGLDVIIVDHHHVGEFIPNASAVINPHQDDCDFPFNEMAAVGVAFSFIMVLKKMVEEDGFFESELPNLKEYMDIVAMGTVADMVPLLDSNRIFVKYGLQQMKKNKRPGIRALAAISGIKTLDDVKPSLISYKMAPRLNAAGRIGNAIKGVELLLCKDFDYAISIAEELNVTNEFRQELEAEIFEQAIYKVENEGLLENNSLILYSKNWHPGVIGIVASRLVEKYFKPTIMISIEGGIGKGSARSIPSLHIYNLLEELNYLLVQYGGHKFAAGLTIKEGDVEEFKQKFDDKVGKILIPEDYVSFLEIDYKVSLDKLTPDLVVALSKLEPFGMSNTEPNFAAYRVKIKKQSIINRSHLHWMLRAEDTNIDFDAIGFGLISDRPAPKVGDIIDIVYFPRINTWGGNVSLQLFIKDFRYSDK